MSTYKLLVISILCGCLCTKTCKNLLSFHRVIQVFSVLPFLNHALSPVADSDGRGLERGDVRWHSFTRWYSPRWHVLLLLLHHPGALWKLYPSPNNLLAYGCRVLGDLSCLVHSTQDSYLCLQAMSCFIFLHCSNLLLSTQLLPHSLNLPLQLVSQ